MRAIIPIILLGSMLFVAFLYANAQFPYMIEDMKITLGMQPAQASTQNPTERDAQRVRASRINALLISDQNKRDLREGRPFWGAATHMIELAMAQPAESSMARNNEKILYEFHVFTFANGRDPVIFEFHNNRLTCAHYPKTKQSLCEATIGGFYKDKTFPFDSMIANK